MENILLQKDNKELKQEIDDQNFYIDDLIKENQNLEDDNAKQKTKLIEYEEKISYLTSEHESNLNFIQNLQKKRNQQKKDFEELCEQFVTLQKKQETSEPINSSLKKEVSESKKRILSYRKITRKFAETVIKLEKNYSEENGQREKYQTLHRLYRTAIESVDEENKEKERKIEKIEKKRVKERKTFQKIEADVIKKSLQMIESKQKKINDLEDQLKMSQETIEKLENEKSTLSDELIDSRDQISQNLNNLQKMITLNSELKKRKFKMKKLLKKTTEENRNYKKSLFLRKKKTRSMTVKPLKTQNVSMASQPDVDVNRIEPVETVLLSNPEPETSSSSPDQKTRSMPVKPLKTQNVSMASQPDVEPVETHSANKSGEEAAVVSSSGHVSGLQRNGSAVTSTGRQPDFSANLCETFNRKELNEVDKSLSTSNAHFVIIKDRTLPYQKISHLKKEYRIEIDQDLPDLHLSGKYRSVGRVCDELMNDEKRRFVGVPPDFKIVPKLDVRKISPQTVEAMVKFFKEKENIIVRQNNNYCTFEEITVKKFRTFFKRF